MLQDLDTTMRSEEDRDDENGDDQSDNDDTVTDNRELSVGCTDGSSTTLDDSSTLAKHTITTENRPDNNNKDTTKSKCCNTCNIKPKSRKSFSMIRCSFCMSWYHEQCVGIVKDEPVGVWLCLSCRKVPEGLHSSITALTSDVEQLKVSTSSIIAALGHLSTQVTSSLVSINDKLTALSNQVSCNDRKMTETLDCLTMASDSMKNKIDQ